MPYAAKAVIEHEFDVDHLNVWVTFRHPMDQSLSPSLSLWILECDDVPVDVVSSVWQDEFTILLTSDTVVSAPDRVTLEYNGPSSNLVTTWEKQWEPWGPILSTYLNAYDEPCFVSRGDVSDWDFETGDFTTDFAYHDLDLSGIVPEGASAVLLTANIYTPTQGSIFGVRENGLTTGNTLMRLYASVSNSSFAACWTVPLDSARFIEYIASNVSWTFIRMTVVGWFF